jgi:PAS domain S-box-containing protein
MSEKNVTELQGQEEYYLYRTVFEQIAAAVVLLDYEGNLIRVNRSFCKLVGLPTSEVEKNRTLLEFIIANDRETVKKSFQTVCSNESASLYMETRLVDDDSSVKFVELWLAALPPSERVLATIVDRSLLWQTQTEIKNKTEDLENLFYLISHNLKSPLVSIQGFTNILLEERDGIEAKELDHYLDRIQKNASRMNTMVQDILEFSKVSKRVHTVDEVVLAEVVNNIYTEFYFRLKEKAIKLSAPNDLPKIVADQDGMNTVFTNLLDNAVKYIGDKDKCIIEIGWEDKGRFYVFWVKDNGIGLESEYHETVFNLFERANVSNKIEGTGVGLAIVKRIVEKHGGMVRLTSEPGKGTTVFFTLPKPVE